MLSNVGAAAVTATATVTAVTVAAAISVAIREMRILWNSIVLY